MYAAMPSPGAALTGRGDPGENIVATLRTAAAAIQEIVRRDVFVTRCPSAQILGIALLSRQVIPKD